MGNVKNKSNKNPQNINEINNNLKQKNLCLSKFHNPFFKHIKTIKNCTFNSFEIYQLKNIYRNEKDKIFYLALASEKEEIINIYKYSYKDNRYVKITSINTYLIDIPQIILKYFYNPLNNKEYLFIVKCHDNIFDDIEIYLIKKEKEYVLINKKQNLLNQFEEDLRSSIHYTSYIKSFDIFYNKYENNIYIITAYFLGEIRDNNFDSYSENFINIKIYQNLNSNPSTIKDVSFTTNNFNNNTFNIIYEDKLSQKYYIIIYDDSIIEFIEINKNLIQDKIQISKIINIQDEIGLENYFFLDINKNYKNSCIINNDNRDYLYISYEETVEINIDENEVKDEEKYKHTSHLMIIDLLTREFVKKLDLYIRVNFMLNWNNKYLILISENSFYIFDININKIISKYLDKYLKIDKTKKISSIKTLLSIEDSFYALFILKENLDIYFC